MDKLSPLASVAATREVLEDYGLITKKSLGQHFLIQDAIVRKICELADLKVCDTVIEVGPGIGTLTIALLKQAHQVISIERDTELLEVLQSTCKPWEDRFALINQDALDVEISDLQKALTSKFGTHENIRDKSAVKLVSNLPYAVAASIILDYFEKFDVLGSATVMVQSEVADRICAHPGSKAYGSYTVKLSLFAEVKGRFSVGPGNFFPPPRVSSSVLRLDRVRPKDTSGFAIDEELRRASCKMADAAFANRRKTIVNSCRTFFSAQGPSGENIAQRVPEILAQANIDPRRRGETLAREDFIELGKAFLSQGI